MEQEQKRPQRLFTESEVYQIIENLDEIKRARQAGVHVLWEFYKNVKFLSASKGDDSFSASDTAEILTEIFTSGDIPPKDMLFKIAVALLDADDDNKVNGH
jgi:hypothetical protein